MQLFAFQTALTEDDVPIWIILLVCVALALLFVGFLFLLISRQVAKSREFSHLERMKALEMGQATGPSEPEKCQHKYLHNVFWICFWLGAGVPLAATSAASTVIMQKNLESFGIILAIWICVAVISIPGVICATVLMISSRNWSSKGSKVSSENGKIA